MAAVDLNALDHSAHFFGRLPVNIVENELSISKDRIQWRTEFMTHIGDELRLMLAFGLELTTFFVDLAKQTRILDGEHGLCGKGLDEVDRLAGVCLRRQNHHPPYPASRPQGLVLSASTSRTGVDKISPPRDFRNP